MPRRPSRNKLARRLLLLLIVGVAVAAAAPVLLPLLPSPRDPGEQSQERLRRASEATGLAVRERLVQLGEDLRTLAHELDPDGRRVLRRDDPRVDRLRRRFGALALARQRGHPVSMLGGRLELPRLSGSQREHLAAGKTLLVTQPAGDGGRVYLLHSVRPSKSSALLIGEASSAHLFQVFLDNALTPSAEFCVLDEASRPVACSLPGEMIEATTGAVALGASGHFAWEAGKDESRLAGYSSVFLEPTFLHQRWTVVLSEPAALSPAPAPGPGIPSRYPLLVLLAIGLITFLSIDQVRRPTVPLEELQELTRRIAEGSFDVDTDLNLGDEFGELTASFRSMAARLKLQFEKLEKLIDVERAVLSAMEPGALAGVVVAQALDLYPCDAAAVVLVHPEDPDSLLAVFSTAGEAGRQRSSMAGFEPKQQRQLSAQVEGFSVDAGRKLPHYLEPFAGMELRSVSVVPLLVRDEPTGVLAVGHGQAEGPDAEQFPYVRALARQASVALGNLRTLDENRALAYYDRLTGLPNRLLFRERVDQALARARRLSHRVGMLLIDLDHFKRINDTFGHDLADEMLKMVSERLASCTRGLTLARLGGDEFAVLISDLRSIEQTASLARGCLQGLEGPFQLEGKEVFVSASIGAAVFPDDADEGEALVKNADAAMYHAKDRGRNNFQFYASSMNEAAQQRMTLESGLRRAVEREELRLYYQPIVDIGRLEIIGMEALVRWQHRELGMVGPDSFISIAEETGLIVPIGEWVLRTACTSNRAWKHAGFPSLRVSVNMSPRQLSDPDLMRAVKRALVESGMYPQNLGLELTEGMLMNADKATLETLEGFRDLGVRLSIDDFGTGYSSLAYLKNFPLDSLKIDRSFVKDVTTNPDDAAIVQAIIAMAHGLKLFVVAEGVETRDQLEFLAEQGCDAAQGLFFSEPLPAEGFEKLLREWQR